MSSRRGGRCVVGATALCPSRYASIRTLGELSLGSSVHDGIRLLELKALQSCERSSWKGRPSSHGAVALLDPKRYLGRDQLLPSATLGSPRAAVVLSSPPLCSSSHHFCSSRLLLLAPIGVVERVVDLPANPQAVQEHTELPSHGHRRSFLCVLGSPRGYLFAVAS